MSEDNDKGESKTVDSPWGKIKNCNSKPLRQPNVAGDDTNLSSAIRNEGGDMNHGSEMVDQNNTSNVSDIVVINSKLNVNAAEFIPCSQKNQLSEDSVSEAAEDVLTYLKHELSCLTVNPGKYKEISEALCDVLKPFVEDANVLRSVISLILDECISEANLRYNGARLCSDLNKMCGTLFRRILLKSCQEEHTKFISNPSPNDPAYLSRICGFGLMLAELFLQIQIEEKNIVVLGEGLLNILQIILNCESERSIKCVCQVLKLTGIKLEEVNESSSSKLDELFSRLQYISAYPDLDPNLRFTIFGVLEMRSSNWGQNRIEQPSSEAPPPVNSDGFNEPVFFGPDGEVITEEETSFLHDNIPLSEDIDDYVCDQDSMDEEVCNDFEEFLRMTERGETKK